MKSIQKVFSGQGEWLHNNRKMLVASMVFMAMLFIVPQFANAQSALKISSLSEVTDTAKEGSDTILNVAKYVLASVLGIALIFVIYSLATNNPKSKEYLLGWIVSVVVIMVAFLII